MTLRKKIRITAISLLLVYTIFRFFLVRSLLEGYGVNPWLFLLIDSATAISYVVGIEHLVVSIVHKDQKDMKWRDLLFWVLITIVSFAAPYMYIYSASHELPMSLGIGIGIIIALLLTNAIVALVRRIRRLKDE